MVASGERLAEMRTANPASHVWCGVSSRDGPDERSRGGHVAEIHLRGRPPVAPARRPPNSRRVKPRSERTHPQDVREHPQTEQDQDERAADDGDPTDVARDVLVFLGGRDGQVRDRLARSRPGAVARARSLVSSAWRSSATIAASRTAARASSSSVRSSGSGSGGETGAAVAAERVVGRAAVRCRGGRCPGLDVLPRTRLAMSAEVSIGTDRCGRRDGAPGVCRRQRIASRRTRSR